MQAARIDYLFRVAIAFHKSQAVLSLRHTSSWLRSKHKLHEGESVKIQDANALTGKDTRQGVMLDVLDLQEGQLPVHQQWSTQDAVEPSSSQSQTRAHLPAALYLCQKDGCLPIEIAFNLADFKKKLSREWLHGHEPKGFGPPANAFIDTGQLQAVTHGKSF